MCWEWTSCWRGRAHLAIASRYSSKKHRGMDRGTASIIPRGREYGGSERVSGERVRACGPSPCTRVHWGGRGNGGWTRGNSEGGMVVTDDFMDVMVSFLILVISIEIADR